MPDRVLLLESDPMRQVGFRAALAAAGYVGVAVSDPEEAAGLLGDGGVHLVLLRPGGGGAAGGGAVRGGGGFPPPLPAPGGGPEGGKPIRQAPDHPPIVALAELPDCV